ncbi:MAG: LemA family protein [Culicoidibacterales bacterium]
MLGLAIIGIVVVGIIFYLINMYNKLITESKRVENAWAQIDVQLKQRVDLIPNIVETVKGYAKHESETLENVISARNMATNAQGVEDNIAANNQLTGALKTLFAVAEAYPDLKANANFMELQRTLKEVEAKIVFARQFYNDTVTRFNTSIAVFPANVLSNLFGFKEAKLFNVSEEDKIVPKVQF